MADTETESGTIRLLGVALGNIGWVSYRTFLEGCTLANRRWWWRLRWAMYWSWFGCAPGILVKRALASKNATGSGRNRLVEEDLVYGETLPGTAYSLLARVGITAEDRVVDLGCGRGVVPLVAALAYNCRACGVDVLPGYVARCLKTRDRLQLQDKVEFIHGDFRTMELPSASIYFIAGTCLPDASWNSLTTRLAQSVRSQMAAKSRRKGGKSPAAREVRAISVSQPLPESDWELTAREDAPFSWDMGRVYIHRWRGQ